MEKLFKLKENGTNVRTEIVAGVTTFLAMAYILAVNPSILSAAGMPSDAIFAATSISAAFATLIMAFFANYPVVLASGMGLNAYFAFSVVPQLASQGITDPWKVALTAILFGLWSTRCPRTSSSAFRQVSVCSLLLSVSRVPALLPPTRSRLSARPARRLFHRQLSLSSATSLLPNSFSRWSASS